ncbi:oxidoreductase [Sulfurifustis variabilis]|uniref:Oxidoreductase n=1 Tax=Sulfurifustis variabilis TaxID=1675686 RepID=A0A1B4V3P2_9GAMM|nr:glucose 1-dehydrogenase [Sulfurifustis variabilis]BAU48163.1 oxidoreductase [Sulfurifustis variabilis]
MAEARVALITGGAQGIGRGIAERFLHDGLRVAMLDFDQEAGRETAAELGERGPVFYVPGDVGREEDVQRCIEAVLARYTRLDVLVNNAGTTRFKPLAEVSLAEWRHILDTNLTGAFLCAKYAEPHLRRARGAVVNIASTHALMSIPGAEAYAASKGGIVALTHALALSLGPDVRVNCVSPGWIDVSAWKKKSVRKPSAIGAEDQRQHPAGRVGRPEDVAAAVAYLVSTEAGFVTGANFVLDGGMTRKMVYV